MKLYVNKNLIIRCGCGRRYDEHKKLPKSKKFDSIISNNPVWRIQDNTETFPTNAFGTIEFQGADIYTTKAEVFII